MRESNSLQLLTIDRARLLLGHLRLLHRRRILLPRLRLRTFDGGKRPLIAQPCAAYASNKSRFDELRQGQVHKEGGSYCSGNTAIYCLVCAHALRAPTDAGSEYFTALGCVFDWCDAMLKPLLIDQHAAGRRPQALHHLRQRLSRLHLRLLLVRPRSRCSRSLGQPIVLRNPDHEVRSPPPVASLTPAGSSRARSAL